MARDDESGITVYPKLPVPAGGGGGAGKRAESRDSAVVIESGGGGGGGGGSRKKLIAVGGVMAVGLVMGFVLRPMLTTDSRIGELGTQLADVQGQLATSRAHADELQHDLDRENGLRKAAESRVGAADAARKDLADRAAATAADKAARETVEAKLRATLDKGQGAVASEGDDIHVSLADKLLFKPGDDQLTDKGKQQLDKLAVALRDLSDKQIWVEDYTDDAPIPPPVVPVVPVAPKAPKPPIVAAAKPPAVVTSWELASARALTVVHYLQDVAKLEPARLASVSFGQYRPASHTDKTKNRRLEIVLRAKPR